MQTNFNVSPPAGMPGMPFDDGFRDVVSLPAHTDIPFGVLVEITTVSGVEEIQVMNDSGTTASFTPTLAGVSLYAPGREQAYQAAAGGGSGYWKKGEMVPVMRRGRVWVQWDGGGTWGSHTSPNVLHSSDGSHGQGVFTFTAAQTTVGNEIDALTNAKGGAVTAIKPELAFSSYTDGFGNTLSAAVVSLNLN